MNLSRLSVKKDEGDPRDVLKFGDGPFGFSESDACRFLYRVTESARR